MIAQLWANKIIDGDKTYAEVPRLLKDSVAEILRTNGKEDLITE